MFKEFLSIFKRNKSAFVLNVVGLSVAFTVLVVIAFQLTYEFGFDRSYKDVDRIYRLEYFDNVATEYGANICVPLIEATGKSIPGIEAYCAMWGGQERLSITDTQGNKIEFWEPFYSVTPGFFDVFPPEIIAGDAKSCLDGDYSIGLAESVARKFFGKESALGKTLNVGNTPVTISLIYKDFPKNSSIGNGVLYRLKNNDWSEWSYIPYFKLAAGVSPEEVTGKMANLDMPGMSKEDWDSYKGRLKFEMLSMNDVYFKSKAISDDLKKGNLNTALSLLAIALLIIGIAYVNFINFSTALAPLRIKRINTQKVMGAMQGELRRSIIVESTLISILSFGLSFVWTNLFIASPAADFFTADLAFMANIGVLITIGCLALVFGVLAGIYPAFYMTSFQPALVLKGTFALTPKGKRLRNSLLVFQFITTVVLITIAVFIKLQHNYMQNMNLGFERENIVYVPMTGAIKKQLNAFTNELTTRPEITDYTMTRFLPGRVGMGWGRRFEGKQVQFTAWPVAHNFLRFFNIKIAEGTDFFAHNEKGVNKVIFNKKFSEKFELNDIIGKEVGCFQNAGQVVGVAENINFNSVRQEVEPMAFICGDDQWDDYVLLKVTGVHLPETIAYIKKSYQKFSPEGCEVRFLDESMDQLYQKEENLAKLISIFGTITILISLMGIYGLILFNARFKIKEIGIRKVNGATEAQILVLLNRGFLKLIAFSFILAVPIAWYIVSEWLSAFPYKTTIYWWVFVLAGVVTLLITLLTVSYQSWKAAIINPVNTLKSE